VFASESASAAFVQNLFQRRLGLRQTGAPKIHRFARGIQRCVQFALVRQRLRQVVECRSRERMRDSGLAKRRFGVRHLAQSVCGVSQTHHAGEIRRPAPQQGRIT